MPQLLLQGFPDGAIRIGSTLSVLKKEGRVTYFIGSDNFYSHPESDLAGRRFAIATLIANGHVRASEVECSLCIPHRTLMDWTGQLEARGQGSFFEPRGRRAETVMTKEKAAKCARLLDEGATSAAAAPPGGCGRLDVAQGGQGRACGPDDGGRVLSRSGRRGGNEQVGAGSIGCARRREWMKELSRRWMSSAPWPTAAVSGRSLRSIRSTRPR